MILVLLTAVPIGVSDPPAESKKALCAVNCAYVAARCLGAETRSFEEYSRFAGPVGKEGLSLAELESLLQRSGLKAKSMRLNFDQLTGFRRPYACIVPTIDEHYVLVAHVDELAASVIDPPHVFECSRDAFAARYDGVALIVSWEEQSAPAPVASSAGSALRIVGGVAATLGVLGLVFAARRRTAAGFVK